MKESKIDYIEYIKLIGKGLLRKKERTEILDVINNPNIVKFCSLGTLNSDKIIYIVRIDAKSGLCALLKNMLELIRFADQYGFVPVVEFSKNIIYTEEDGFMGTSNPFEYYFEQPMSVSLKEAHASRNVVFSNIRHINSFASSLGYEISNEQIFELGRIYKKYIRLTKDLDNEFKLNTFNMFDHNRILGVHFRGTDFAANYKNHPVFITAREYLSKVEQLMGKGQYDYVFLATDDQGCLDLFHDALKEKLLYTDAVMRSSQTPLHLTKHNRRHDKYLLGKEVLSDVFSLSRCTSLIAGRSNVSIMARIVNASLQRHFNECVILDSGLNKSGNVLRVK